MTTAWPVNSLTKQPEPPAKDWLITCLADFGGDTADPTAIIDLAVRFAFAITSIRTRLDKTTVSPKNELKDLYAAARRSIKTNDNAHWLKAWAAVKDGTREMVWRPPLEPVRRAPKPPYRKPGKAISPTAKVLVAAVLAPRPHDVLPLIDEAMRQLAAKPTEQRRRSSDRLYDELDDLLREAWLVLRRTPLPKPISAERAGGKKLQSKLLTLAREIDRHFGLGIYVANDGRRLRGLSRSA